MTLAGQHPHRQRPGPARSTRGSRPGPSSPTCGRCPARSGSGWRACWRVLAVGGRRRAHRAAAGLGGVRDDALVRVGPADRRLRLLRDHHQRPVPGQLARDRLRHRPLPAAREAPRDPRRPVPDLGVRDHRARPALPVRMVFGAVLSPVADVADVVDGRLLRRLPGASSWSRSGRCSGTTRSIHQWACTLAACMAIVAPLTLGAVFGVLVATALLARRVHPAAHGRLGLPRRDVAPGHRLLPRSVRFRLAGFERADRLAMPGLRLLLGIGLVVVAVLLTRQIVGRPDWATNAACARRPRRSSAVRWPPSSGSCGSASGSSCRSLLVVLPGDAHERLARSSPGSARWPASSSTGCLFVAGGEIAPVTTSAGVVSNPYAAYTAEPGRDRDRARRGRLRRLRLHPRRALPRPRRDGRPRRLPVGPPGDRPAAAGDRRPRRRGTDAERSAPTPSDVAARDGPRERAMSAALARRPRATGSRSASCRSRSSGSAVRSSEPSSFPS